MIVYCLLSLTHPRSPSSRLSPPLIISLYYLNVQIGWMPNFEIQVAELDGDGASDIALQSTIDGHYEFLYDVTYFAKFISNIFLSSIVNGEPYYMSNIEVAGYWEKGYIKFSYVYLHY